MLKCRLTLLTRGRVAATAAGMLLIFSAPSTEAQYRRVAPRIVELPPTEGRGCYFYRGREYCGSYCYWEVNGKRYCQQRLRHAHSQVPPPDVFIPGGLGLK